VKLAGRKPWGLLAYLALSERPPSRREAIAQLVSEANDPQAALRWLLHQVRRALRPEAAVEEEHGRLVLRLVDAEVDLFRLLDASDDLDGIEGLAGGELLEGMVFDDAPGFELWLSMQRSRVANVAAEALWWAATRLASKDPERSVRLVERGLSINPYCEGKHELLVDLHLQQGNRAAAVAHVEAVTRLFETDLGLPLPETIRRPLDRPRSPTSIEDAAPSARALLQSARARLAAGDYRGAVQTARRSADVSLAVGDPELELAALTLLASVLIHTHRGRDAEAKGLLARAAQLASDLGHVTAQADIERDVGFVLGMEGQLGAAESALARSVAFADSIGDDERAAKAETHLGMCRSDRCDIDGAEDILARAIERFRDSGALGWQGYAEGMLARVYVRSGDPARALAIARAGEERCRAGAWTAMVPWPMLVAAESSLALGDERAARDGFVEALTLGREIGDPCWEALGLRGLAAIRRRAGDRQETGRLLEDALTACTRFEDVYAWARAVILTELVELAAGRDLARLDEALELTTAAPMPDLAARLWAFRQGVVGQTASQTHAP
jgi:DNA-binding SARP family transcriptional activator